MHKSLVNKCKIFNKHNRTKTGLYKFVCDECKKDAVKKVWIPKQKKKGGWDYEFCSLRCLKKFKGVKNVI